jgi:hypothetical protein
VTGLWQEHYNIPRTDPRYLSSTAVDHLQDMYGVMVRNGVQRRATDKVEAAADHIDEIVQAHERIRTSITEGPMGKAMVAFEKKRNAKPELETRIVTVRARKFKNG